MHKWGLLFIVCLSPGALANSVVPADGVLSLIQQTETEMDVNQSNGQEPEGLSSSLFFDEPQIEVDPEGDKLEALDKEPEDLLEDDFLSGAFGELDSKSPIESSGALDFPDSSDSSDSIDSLLISTNPLDTLF